MIELKEWLVTIDTGRGAHPVGKVKTTIEAPESVAFSKAWKKYVYNGLCHSLEVTEIGNE